LATMNQHLSHHYNSNIQFGDVVHDVMWRSEPFGGPKLNWIWGPLPLHEVTFA